MAQSQGLQQRPLTELRGVRERTAEKLAGLGLTSIQDLLLHLPLRYLDQTRIRPIGSLQPGNEALVVGTVDHAAVTYGRRRTLIAQINDGTGSLQLRFFHFNGKQQAGFSRNSRVRCFGEARRGAHSLEMVHPHYRLLRPDESATVAKGLTPVYPAGDGVTQATLSRLIDQALEKYLPQLPELLPEPLRHSLDLPTQQAALTTLHHPEPGTEEDLLSGQHPALQRLACEELLAQHLSLRQLRTLHRQQKAPAVPPAGTLTDHLIRNLGFSLTGAQDRVLTEISQDLAQPRPMQRLVQGDVGSGKTVVAAATALQLIEAGYQVALMAPTELLAEQHFRNFQQWFEPLGITTLLLLGKQLSGEKKQIEMRLADEAPLVAIGTQALFQERIRFARLGLIIIDEQHRFGVHQRLELRKKSRLNGLSPHQLVLTATPIPRSLAMTFYADLDSSVIDELPPGRQPVSTVALPDSRRGEIIERIRHACDDGRQVYWVCPLIEESDVLQAQAATVTEESLRLALPELKVGLLHGRMKSPDKEAVMAAFQAGTTDLLVATTVIEVGVDVPNASLMVIENSERLGLAQLHQLRGRVGRGQRQSSCVLLYQPPLSHTARQRLAAMRETVDGFEIARRDLALRGPGELLGTRQTGAASFRIADLTRDQALIPKVVAAADWLLEHQPDAIQPLIDRWLSSALEYARV
ncbi:MAG: ATP-dependent DNA helicase RecG [Gammaproteobacteria bacterium]|nr:ATP-dependent DNA helicase RecG [Gammaproteobacteria bacterium]